MTPLAEGRLLASRFRLVRRLGEGGLGEVWLAQDIAGDFARDVAGDLAGRRGQALKILAADLSRDPARVELFRREFAIGQSLVHPAILRPGEFFSGEGRHFFTMPALGGGHLGEQAGEPWTAAANRLLPICDALAYAHRKGVVHGDLKPRNILVDDAGAPHVTDFGAARVRDDAADARIRRPGGSLAYMSPQLLEGRAAGPGDDIYALGCVCHEMLCGYPPYAPDISEPRILAGRLETPAEPEGLPPLPGALVELVTSMLAADEAARPVTVQTVRSALEDILRDSSAGMSEAAAIVARTRAAAREQTAALERSKGVPVGLAYALGGLLLAAAAALFVFLPRFAEQRAAQRPLPTVATQPEETAPKVDLQLVRAQREAADEAMGEMLRDRNYLATLQPALWSGGAWQRAVAREQQADDLYRRREYPDAQAAYGKAAGLLRELREQAPDIGRRALQAAQQAIENGDQPVALAELEKAGILLGEAAPAVQTARARAGKLPQIMQAVEAARNAARDGSLEQQRDAWRQVLNVDPPRQSARQALAKVNAALEERLFGSRMSRGHAALADGDLDAAREAFEAARKQRPKDPTPGEALVALELEERGRRLAELQAAALASRFREDWRTAAGNYRGMLDIDAGIVAAQQGLAVSENRARLDEALEQTIASATGLNRDDAWQQGKRLLDQARSIAGGGSRLGSQIERLEKVLTVAATPAPVRLQSDGLTEVTIFHVGRLGSFADRMLELRPGAYTAVGRRDGYRDVRREFVVSSQGLPGPLIVICTEPI